MKVQVMSRKLIKPWMPIHINLRNFKISNLDELNATMNVVAIIYYPSGFTNKIRLNHLKESLAEILPHFYPLAGRYIKENHFIDSSDQGAEYVEAQAISSLRDKVMKAQETLKRQPSRVQLMSALIVKAIVGVDRKKHGKSRALLISHVDTKGSDGIEAWIHLDEKDMYYFEQDEEIKHFTT
ncbi:Uncharacterized protein Fot_22506 [Forsythia ovata]|uniref:Uncharacterized protein n=1 Tax=Forsythia ovata TaxID=205694 RepID=A0ABD1UXW8_9LAMI